MSRSLGGAGRPRSTLRSAALSVALLGVLLGGFGVYLVTLSPVQQSRSQTNLEKTLSGTLGNATAPVSGVIPVGTPVALLEIPRLGVRQVVVEGTTSGLLTLGPGHRRDTPLPGQAGTSVLLGRSALFGGPFGGLGDLVLDDEIVVTTGQGRSTYSVAARRDSTQAATPVTEADGVLLLSTAAPPLAPDRSLVVTALLEGDAFPGRTTPVAIADVERGLTPDGSVAITLMLWGQALVIVSGATAWAYLRWERWPTYVLSTPVLLAVLWNVYENAAQLLPNTM